MARMVDTMAEVPSTFTLELGQPAPQFNLPDGNGKQHGFDTIKGPNGTLIAFVCNHCPFVIHLAKELGQLALDYEEKGISTVAINANDVMNYPQDSPEKMLGFAKEMNWKFPYLYDETQLVAQAYSAACTPDFFLFDDEGNLYYAGQFDDSRPGNNLAVDGEDLRTAIDNLIADEPPAETMKPATGCNIKWKAGNEPSYFA